MITPEQNNTLRALIKARDIRMAGLVGAMEGGDVYAKEQAQEDLVEATRELYSFINSITLKGE